MKKRNLRFKKIVRKVAKLESETAGVLNCCANNHTEKQDCYMNNRWWDNNIFFLPCPLMVETQDLFSDALMDLLIIGWQRTNTMYPWCDEFGGLGSWLRQYLRKRKRRKGTLLNHNNHNTLFLIYHFSSSDLSHSVRSYPFNWFPNHIMLSTKLLKIRRLAATQYTLRNHRTTGSFRGIYYSYANNTQSNVN